MKTYTEDEVRAFTAQELISALVSCSIAYGSEGSGGSGSVFHPELNRRPAGLNMCLCQKEALRRLELVPAV